MEAEKITKKEQRKCFKCGMPFVATLVRKAFSNDWWGPLACSSCCARANRDRGSKGKATQRKLWDVCADP